MLVHFLNWNWTIATVVVTVMACIFEIDLLLDAHKMRDRDIVQLCLPSGHCCCSRKTCNTEAWTQCYPNADIHRMPSLHSHTCTFFGMKLINISVDLHQTFVVYFASTNLEEVGLKANTSTNMVFL